MDNLIQEQTTTEPCCAPSADGTSCCEPTTTNETAVPESNDAVRNAVRDNYAQVAIDNEAAGGLGTGTDASCCGTLSPETLEKVSAALGYDLSELENLPAGANMGLGCGNPQAIANLKSDETVLDLGSGGGIDCFLAAKEVGENGFVIGVDMTPEMITKSRANAEKGGFANVNFRLGEIEHLPVADNTVDAIISNCVINLSPNKGQVFKETFRVLKPGGRLAISDIVATADLPADIRESMALFTGCMAGASLISELETMMTEAGFESISIQPKDESKTFIKEWAPGRRVEEFVVSASIEAVKPL